jgi:hypothetical protein
VPVGRVAAGVSKDFKRNGGTPRCLQQGKLSKIVHTATLTPGPHDDGQAEMGRDLPRDRKALCSA